MNDLRDVEGHILRYEVYFEDGQKYPIIAESAPEWLSRKWNNHPSSVEGLYFKPHLYYA